MTLQRLALALPICLSTTLVAGCSRSSDGTVIIPRHMDSRRFWQDDEAKRTAIEQAQAGNFPAGSEEIRFVDPQSAPTRRSPRARPANPAQASDATPLACRAVTGPSGRVRYACE
ncbi:MULTISPECIES: hypothetical protein [Hyphomicrobiales]|jgi:hypothetical protein|uniref:hypothetical protein n=1 Tax=Hyphomicrobiales TaxID=356 RepID=UPI0003827C88|nr:MULTISPECIES: hypothetical protein [Phyllobacteriaceae]MCX8570126.1 hypothetical protein [Aminobacter sp. MET-1]